MDNNGVGGAQAPSTTFNAAANLKKQPSRASLRRNNPWNFPGTFLEPCSRPFLFFFVFCPYPWVPATQVPSRRGLEGSETSGSCSSRTISLTVRGRPMTPRTTPLCSSSLVFPWLVLCFSLFSAGNSTRCRGTLLSRAFQS